MGPDGTKAEKENLLQSFSEVESMHKLMKEFQKSNAFPPSPALDLIQSQGQFTSKILVLELKQTCLK